jgi:drug/metabolite transporter (DMT)-like permease
LIKTVTGLTMWYFYAIAASALWGLEYALIGRLFDGRVSPLFLLPIQMLVGAAVLGTVCFATGTFHAQIGAATRSSNTMMLIFMSTVVFTLGSFLIATSVKEGSALLAGLAEISYPLFILIFTVMLGWAEPVSARALVGGILILVGSIFIKTS